MRGATLAFPFWIRELSSGSAVILLLVPSSTALHIGAVKKAASIGDAHDPCGTPVLIGLRASHLPSSNMVAVRSYMKLSTHHTIRRGIRRSLRVFMRWVCGIESKKPVMLNVSMVTTLLWFQAASMSCMIVMTASWADLPKIPLYCVEGNRLCLAAMYDSLLAWILSRVFPSTSNSWINL